MNEFEEAIDKVFKKLKDMPDDEFREMIKKNKNAPLARLIQYAMEPEKFIESNKIDLVEVITKYGTGSFQDFEGFIEKQELKLLKKEIKKASKLADYKEDPEYTQILCDIVLIKIIGELNEGESDLSYYINSQKTLDYMIFWNDLLSCRYLLKSGIDWSNVKE